MKKFVAIALVLCMAFALCACGEEKTPDTPDETKIKIGMVTDVGGVNDKSFNAYEAKASCQLIKIVETPKPVPITLAEMRDARTVAENRGVSLTKVFRG